MGSLGTGEGATGSLGLGSGGGSGGGGGGGGGGDSESDQDQDELAGFVLSPAAQYDEKRAEFERSRERARRREAVARRSLSVVFRSPQQLRGFNFPYQLGYCPPPSDSDSEPDIAAALDASGSASKPASAPRRWFESPDDADVIRVPVRPGDLVVLATDGLFDNVHEEEILREIHRWTKEEGGLLRAAAEGSAEAWAPRPYDRDVHEGSSDTRGASSGSRRALDLLRGHGEHGAQDAETGGWAVDSESESVEAVG